jgi:hypothetical protein
VGRSATARTALTGGISGTLLAACSLLVDTSGLSGGAPEAGAAAEDALSDASVSPEAHEATSDDGPGVDALPDAPPADGPADVVTPSDAPRASDAADSAIESSDADSGIADGGPPDVGAPGWSTADIGAVQAAGSWCFGSQCIPALSAGTYRVSGSGADLGLCSGEVACGYGTYDEFRYVYRSISGDATLTARLVSIQNVGSDWSKAFVMMRDGLASDAAFVATGVSSGTAHGYLWIDRSTVAGAAAVDQTASSATPVWLQVTRRGSAFTGSVSPDGSAWTPVGSFTLSLSTSLDVGLGVVSHVNGTLAAGTFDSVSLTTP